MSYLKSFNSKLFELIKPNYLVQQLKKGSETDGEPSWCFFSLRSTETFYHHHPHFTYFLKKSVPFKRSRVVNQFQKSSQFQFQFFFVSQKPLNSNPNSFSILENHSIPIPILLQFAKPLNSNSNSFRFSKTAQFQFQFRSIPRNLRFSIPIPLELIGIDWN